MENLKKLMQDKWKLCAVIAVVIIVILIIALIATNASKNSNNSNGENNPEVVKEAEEVKEEPIRIMLNEDLDKEGYVEKLDNVSWTHANINQHDKTMDVFIDLRNNSAKDKVKSKKLKVTLLNKQGKEIASKEATMKEMDINGTTNLQVSFDAQDYVVVYDLAISAK